MFNIYWCFVGLPETVRNKFLLDGLGIIRSAVDPKSSRRLIFSASDAYLKALEKEIKSLKGLSSFHYQASY